MQAILDSTANCEEANRSSNEEDENTNTPLHLSAICGHAAIANIIIKCGADVDAM